MFLNFVFLLLFDFCCLSSGENRNDLRVGDGRYPCNSDPLLIAYDKSNGLSETEFNKETSFLINYVFNEWTHFNGFTLLSYANIDPRNDGIVPNGMDDINAYVSANIRVHAEPTLCQVIAKYSGSKLPNIICFISKFNATDIESCGIDTEHSNPANFLTFVVMNSEIETDLVRSVFPQSQILRWNISTEDFPPNWEWVFRTSYGCNEDGDNDAIYPCNKRIFIGFDSSSNIEIQKQFSINDVFNSYWNNFNNLALMGYSTQIEFRDFGSFVKLNDIHDFIDAIPNTTVNNTQVSLCKVFEALTEMFLRDINIILFVNTFHTELRDECPAWMKQVRENANSIKFITLNKNVNENYLLAHFPQAEFVYWNIGVKDGPAEFQSQFFYGCDEYTTNAGIYPCRRGYIYMFYDNSHHLTPIIYQQLIKFLLTRLLIDKWTNLDMDLSTLTDGPEITAPPYLINFKTFFRQQLRINKEPEICDIFDSLGDDEIPPNRDNLIFFISTFDEEMSINEKAQQILFIALTSQVNQTYLSIVFSNATIVTWNAENNDEPIDNWEQIFWEAFNCTGPSPIIKIEPKTTTVKTSTTQHLTTTTSQLTTTVSSSTKSSTHTQTPTISSTSLSTTTSENKNSVNILAILLGVFIPLFLILICIIVFVVWWLLRRSRQQLVENMASNDRTNNTYDKEEEDVWEISFDRLNINFMDKLGSGEFGDVYLGRLIGDAPITQIYNDSPHCQRFNNCEVAIKTLPAMNVDNQARNEFWKEIEFMKSLRFHVNLVCFLGYVNDTTNPLMLLEYCQNGDLLKFIKSNKQKFIESFETDSNNKTLISFAWQISSGLEYLGSLGLIHRDIAARNILLDKNNVCKVSDFGLCRNSTNQLYLSSGGKLPVKWMAPESLKENVFSTKTDVWSYGVLLWELFTLGSLPYSDVESVLAFLESGQRLSKPHYSTDEIYEIMSDCWLVDPDDRPTFTIICQLLTKMIETATMHYNYVDTLALIEEANQIVQIEEIEEANQIESNSSFVEI